MENKEMDEENKKIDEEISNLIGPDRITIIKKAQEEGEALSPDEKYLLEAAQKQQ